MSAIDTALHAAAEAIRALPDRELVALALAAPLASAGQAQTVVDNTNHARPVTASAAQPEITIRLGNAVQEAATRSPGPTRAVRHLSRAPTLVQVEAQRRVLNALRDGPLGYAAIQRASGLKPGGGMQRMMQSLIASGQIAKSPVGSYVLTGTLQPDQPERPWQDATALVMARHLTTDSLERVTANEDPPRDADPPYVCPGCHAVGEERCLDGCIDHEIEAETRHAIESGDYSPVGWRSVGEDEEDEDEDEDEDVIVAGMPLPFVQVGMIVRPDDCQNPLFCSDCTGLVCAMRDDDRDRANMVATLLFRDGKRRDEWSDVLRRHWRLVRDFDPSRVYTGRWSRGGPTAEVVK